MDFDFKRFARVPILEEERLPFAVTKTSFRQYTLHVDPADPAHAQALQDLCSAVIQQDRLTQIDAHAYLVESGAVARIAEFRAARPRYSYRPDFIDLALLYLHIRSTRPESVLEYGSGVSTVVMAHALHQNGRGRLVSLEPSQAWAEATRAAIPGDLRGFCEVVYSAGTSCDLDGRATVCFAERPIERPDMIYIDGAPEGAVFCGAENVAHLEATLRPDAAIFIDGRRHAVEFFLDPARAGRYSVLGWSVLLVDARNGRNLGPPFGMDQFANAMVQVRPQVRDRAAIPA